MSYDLGDYWQEAFEIAMEESGCGNLLAQMTREQREGIGGALAGCAECQSMAFPTPVSPYREESDRLSRKLKWERDRVGCGECGGRGRLEYNTGPWGVNTECHVCRGEGKVHPRGEREPA